MIALYHPIRMGAQNLRCRIKRPLSSIVKHHLRIGDKCTICIRYLDHFLNITLFKRILFRIFLNEVRYFILDILRIDMST